MDILQPVAILSGNAVVVAPAVSLPGGRIHSADISMDDIQDMDRSPDGIHSLSL